MLVIRMQRTGRSGHAQFRVIVQDSHFHPTRGKIVAYLGSYNPHTKTAQIDKELASRYLSNGAQPSDRVAKLLKSEGVKLPDWVKLSAPQKREVRNPDKRRSTRPPEPEAPAEELPVAEATRSAEDAGTEGPTPEEAQPEKDEDAGTEAPAPEESPAAEVDKPGEAEAEAVEEKPATEEVVPEEAKASEPEPEAANGDQTA